MNEQLKTPQQQDVSSDDENTENIESSKPNFMERLSEDFKTLDLEEKFEFDAPIFSQMLSDYERSIDRANNEKMRRLVEDNRSKSVKWTDQTQSDSDDDDYADYDDDDDVSDESDKENRSSVIRITHTKVSEELERNRKVSRDKGEIETPADIYSVFYRPKSILKNAASLESEIRAQDDDYLSKSEQQPQQHTSDTFKFERQKVETYF